MKLPVSVTGPFMVIEAGLFVPEYEPEPVPVQLLKLYPLADVALIDTVVPLPLHPLEGLTVPPVLWLIVR